MSNNANDIYIDATYNFLAAVSAYSEYFIQDRRELGYAWAMRQLNARVDRGKTWTDGTEFSKDKLIAAVIREVNKAAR